MARRRASNGTQMNTPRTNTWDAYRPSQRWTMLGILSLIAITSYIDRSVLQVLMEPIKEEFGLSDSALGLLSGAPFALSYALSSLPFARMADRSGRKRQLLIAMVIWSVMTAVCGFATSLLMLFIARMGVGLGEGGAVGSSHALIADYFPPRDRNVAFGLFAMTSTVGTLMALIGGAVIAEQFGWRAAFIVLALLSAPVLLIALIWLDEPRRDSSVLSAAASGSMAADVRALLAKQSYTLLLVGITFYAFFVFGALMFVPSLLMRVHGMSLSQVGTSFGLIAALATLAGTGIGGVLATRLAQRDVRWLMRFAGIVTLLALPLVFPTFLAENVGHTLIGLTLIYFLLACALPAVFSTVQLVCGAERRSMGGALLMAVLNGIGMTLGPIAAGYLSDLFAASHGVEGIRFSIITVGFVLIPAGLLMFGASLALRKDQEDVWQ